MTNALPDSQSLDPNFSPNPPHMRSFKPWLLAAGFLAFAAAAWHVGTRHNIPIEHAVNPIWWVRHMEGKDLYDQSGAILFHGNPKLREVALTVDDGPNRIYGPQILEVLKQYDCPATFFVVGVRVKDAPQLIQEMVADGDEVGNHTYDHQRLPGLKPHQIANELRNDDINIFRAAGIRTNVMRPPGMEYNDKVLGVTKALGYTCVSWTVAAKDYLDQDPQWIANRVIDRTENGSIILLHQDTPDTAKSLPAIITGLRAKGYTFVTISTMLAHLNVEPYASQESRQPPSATKPAPRSASGG